MGSATSGSTFSTDSATSSSSGVVGDTECTPPGVDGSEIGQDCSAMDCPDGYDCIDHNGIVLQQLCGILCDEDCDCPADHTCTAFMDKAGTHYECTPS